MASRRFGPERSRSRRSHSQGSSATENTWPLFWTGIQRVVSATTGEDVERIVGFDEGPIPEDWAARLESRGIEVEREVLREEACAVLRRYAELGGEVYNSGKG